MTNPHGEGELTAYSVPFEITPEFYEAILQYALGAETICVFEERDPRTLAPARTVVVTGEVETLPVAGKDDPFNATREFLARHTINGASALPFVGGVVAVIDYDSTNYALPGHQVPRVPTKPSAWLIPVLEYIVIDHVHGGGHYVRLVESGQHPEASAAAVTEAFETLLNRTSTADPSGAVASQPVPTAGTAVWTSREEYERMVLAAQTKMVDEAVDEAVISLEMRLPGAGTTSFGELYRRLRETGTATYMFCVASGELHLAGSTPLGLAEIEGHHIRVETDAGTRTVSAEDGNLSQWRITVKEHDEHDFALRALREDVAKIAVPGSIEVETGFEPRRFGNVAHLFAELSAELHADVDQIEAVRGLFPHGGVSGWPKGRSVDLIATVEGQPRGIFGGVVGLLGFDGRAQVATVIRSAWRENDDLVARFGASITLASEPAAEYDECVAKAQAMLGAWGG